MARPARHSNRQLIFSRPEQRAVVIEALKLVPNARQVYRCLGKRIGVSYGTIWNIARAERIKLIRIDRRRLAKRRCMQ